MLLSRATLAVLALSSVALALNDSPEMSRRSLSASKKKAAARKASLSSVKAHKASLASASRSKSAAKAKASASKKKKNVPGCFPTSVAYSKVFNFRQTTDLGCAEWCNSQGEFDFVAMDLWDQDGSPSETPSCYCLGKKAKLTAPVEKSQCGAEWGSSPRGYAIVMEI